ncbi:MAG: hypothetical protein A2Z37_01290 [Chloroflexi bacterium RBG_19FT_COMBO_62_14]|nr:MAG: hypothetical protein A2Z37_01290 [Chloroflexi bacterium RBG_19FT_COMBO_62_14]
MIRIPELRWVVRLVWVVVGPAWFVWIAVEERTLGPVMLLAALVSSAFAITGLARWRSGSRVERRRWLLESTGVGLAAGASVAPIASLLILIKISIHAHGTPDFDLTDIGAVMGRMPVWMLVGALCGEALGLAIVAAARREEPGERVDGDRGVANSPLDAQVRPPSRQVGR